MAFGPRVEDAAERSSERFGTSSEPRPDGCLIWVLTETAAAAGPAPVLARSLAARLDRPVRALVTPLDEAPLAPAVERDVIHQLAPGDTAGTIGRFLDHWRPDFGIVIDEPARPRLLAAAHARGIELFHASSHRQTGQSAKRFPAYLREFNRCFAASASDADLLRSHLRKTETQIEISGPLSDTVLAEPYNEQACDELLAHISGRPVWLAVGIEGLEVEVVEAAHRKAFRAAHRLLLILVPSDPLLGDEIAEKLEARGWRVGLRSRSDDINGDIQIYIADTEGELGLWYRLAPATFIGGTLRAAGEPVDPFGPAALGSAVLCGPHHGKSTSRFKALLAQTACMPVANSEELSNAVVTLLAPDQAASLAQAGWSVTTESAHVVERLSEVMEERVYEREDAL